MSANQITTSSIYKINKRKELIPVVPVISWHFQKHKSGFGKSSNLKKHIKNNQKIFVAATDQNLDSSAKN